MTVSAVHTCDKADPVSPLNLNTSWMKAWV